MLKKRIIPCLDIRDGRTVKGINFLDIRDAGDPVEQGRLYAEQGADELVFLDITATIEGRKTFSLLVERIGREINIPFTVGGGINTIEDVAHLLQSGADKVSVNTAAVRNPDLISELAAEFGSQCIVVAIDTNLHKDVWIVYTHGGRTATDMNTLDWVAQAEQLGAGEILLTSMVHDGMKQGFAIELLRHVCAIVNIPVIASGGAGDIDDFIELFQRTDADAALAASIFHYGEVQIPDLKHQLRLHQIPIR